MLAGGFSEGYLRKGRLVEGVKDMCLGKRWFRGGDARSGDHLSDRPYHPSYAKSFEASL